MSKCEIGLGIDHGIDAENGAVNHAEMDAGLAHNLNGENDAEIKQDSRISLENYEKEKPEMHSLSGSDFPNSKPSLEKPKGISRWRTSKTAVALVIGLAIFTDMVVYGIVIPTLPEMVTVRLGLDPAYLGILLSCYALGLLVVTPLVGVVSDRYKNRKIPMLIGLAGLLATTLLYALSNTFAELILARTGQGIAGGITWTVGFGMLADIYPKEKLGLVTSSVLTANSIGFLVGPPIGGFLFQYLGDAAPFYFCIGLALLDLAGRLFVQPEQIPRARSPSPSSSPSPLPDLERENTLLETNLASESNCIPKERVSRESSLMQDKDSKSIEREETVLNLKDPETVSISIWIMLTDPQMLVSMICVLADAAVFAAIEATLPIYLLRRFESSPSQVGLIWVAMIIPNTIGCIYAGHVSDKYGRKNITALGMLVFAISCPLVSLSPNIIWLCFAAALFGLGNSFACTPALPEMADFMHARNSHSFATAYALYNCAYSVGMLVGPIAGSYIYDLLGFDSQMYVSGGLLLSLSPVALLFWYIGKPKTSITCAASVVA